MMVILDDRSKFRQLGPAEKFDYTLKIEKAFQKRFDAMLAAKNNSIGSEVYNAIYPLQCQRPKMYGLPKTHKSGTPLRPVLSIIGSPQHSLAKWLVKMLHPVLAKFSTYTVKDSFSFAEYIREVKLPTKCSYLC